MPPTTSSPDLTTATVARGFAASLLCAIAWVVLALSHPTTTYHFAPLVTVVAAPLAARWRVGRAMRVIEAALLAALAAVVATLALVSLEAADALRGPVVLGGSGFFEALIAVAAGIAIGATATAASAWRWRT